MKKLHVAGYALLSILAISCWHHDNDIDISYSDADQYYSMKAYFSKSKTRVVEEYMDKRLGKRSNMSFVNSRIDGTVALDDHTVFYIKKSPGVLNIKLDKDENSEEAYKTIKSMCEGIKPIVTHSP